jgi:protoheme ferro-lyase
MKNIKNMKTALRRMQNISKELSEEERQIRSDFKEELAACKKLLKETGEKICKDAILEYFPPGIKSFSLSIKEGRIVGEITFVPFPHHSRSVLEDYGKSFSEEVSNLLGIPRTWIKIYFD